MEDEYKIYVKRIPKREWVPLFIAHDGNEYLCDKDLEEALRGSRFAQGISRMLGVERGMCCMPARLPISFEMAQEFWNDRYIREIEKDRGW